MLEQETMLAAGAGAAAMLGLVLVIVLLKRLFRKKIQLVGLKGKIEEADKNLREAHNQLDSLYKIFTEIENRQEELLK